jgi:GNAT superfamily N-acetyltransferase
MSGPVTDADVDCVEQFYRSHSCPTVIDLCPLADFSLTELLGRRGYRITEFSNVLVRPVEPGYEFDDLRVHRVLPEEEAAWCRTAFRGFFERDQPTREEAELMALLFHMKRSVPWLAVLEGAGAAAAAVSIEDRLALCFGGSTVPGYRRRGLQSALIQARQAYASKEGCDFVAVATPPGSISQRNYERLGFRIVYTRIIMAGPPEVRG